jgi:hypothetical protein
MENEFSGLTPDEERWLPSSAPRHSRYGRLRAPQSRFQPSHIGAAGSLPTTALVAIATRNLVNV